MQSLTVLLAFFESGCIAAHDGAEQFNGSGIRLAADRHTLANNFPSPAGTVRLAVVWGTTCGSTIRTAGSSNDPAVWWVSCPEPPVLGAQSKTQLLFLLKRCISTPVAVPNS
jgi:hypothetical protein